MSDPTISDIDLRRKMVLTTLNNIIVSIEKRFKMQSWMRFRIPLLIAFLAFILAAPVYFLYEQV